MIDNKQFPKGVEVVGSAIIENSKGEILLVKSPKWSNKWTMPGGHIEPGEKIEDALLREAEEEVGLKLKSEGIVAFGELINSKYFHRPAHFVYFDILCKTADTNIKLDNEELTEYIWINPEKALTMDLAESYDKTIKDYLKYKNEKELVKTFIVAGVVIKKDNKFLLVQEKQLKVYGLWNFPAGRVEIDDTIEETAIREAREETGYNIELIRKIAIFQEKANEPPKHAFEAKIIRGELKYPKDEILDVKWFSFKDIKKMKEKLRGKWIIEAINILENAN